jgi:hypothetical protein
MRHRKRCSPVVAVPSAPSSAESQKSVLLGLASISGSIETLYVRRKIGDTGIGSKHREVRQILNYRFFPENSLWPLLNAREVLVRRNFVFKI